MCGDDIQCAKVLKDYSRKGKTAAYANNKHTNQHIYIFTRASGGSMIEALG